MSQLINDLDQPVYVLTSSFNGQNAGCVITWLTKASLNEKIPKIVFVMSKFNDTCQVLIKSRSFTLNLLASDQSEHFYHFGLEHSFTKDKFASVEHRRHAAGLILAHTAGFAEGRIESLTETPDRIICYASLIHQEPSQRPGLKLRSALEQINPEQRQKLKNKMAADTLRDEKQFT